MSDEKDEKPQPIPHHEPTGNYGTGAPDGGSLPGITGGNNATSADVLAEIQQRAQKHLPLYAKRIDELPPVRIFNVWSETWIIQKGSLGVFTIQACEEWSVCSKPLEIPAILREASAYGVHPSGGTSFQWFTHDGREVAADIIGAGKCDHPSQSLRRYGVFVAAGALPSGAEIEAARFELYKTCIKLVSEANDFFDHRNESRGMLINIQRMHQKSLQYLQNYTPEWKV